MTIIAGVAGKHLLTTSKSLQKSLQQEWNFVKCVTLDIGTAFQPVEDDLRNVLPPSLFKGATYHISERAVTRLPLN